jgi:hypothetical protein
MRLFVLGLVFLSACSGYDDLGLLEIEEVQPREIEPGTTLRIRGEGFPLGHAPEVRVRGVLHRPGLPAGTIDAQMEGVVRSGSLIEVPVSPELLASLGGRASVDGELRVSFRSADGRRDVFAVERTRLDFLPDTATQLRVDDDRDEAKAAEPADAFGLVLSHEELGTPGVRVERIRQGSFAARQGLAKGDTIVGLDGVTIYGWRDFVPDPTKTESTVLVSRDGLRGVHALRWPHAATLRSSNPLSIIVFVVLGLVVGWWGPMALALRKRTARLPISTWTLRVSLLVAFAALMVLLPVLQWTTMWILALGAVAALFALATRERASTASFALMVSGALTVMLSDQTASVVGIVGGQGTQLLAWNAWQGPATSLAFFAYLAGLGEVCMRPRVSASLFAAPAAVLGATLFLAGWPVEAPVAGLALLSLKAVVLLVAARALRIPNQVAAALGAAALSLALAGLFIDLGALFPQWSALMVGVLVAAALRAALPPFRRASAPVPA